MFRVGMRVICVDAKFPDPNGGYGDEVLPENRCAYTIRDIGIHPDPAYQEFASVLLEEIVNKARPYTNTDRIVRTFEPRFRATRFRPLVTKSTETGMSILRGISNGQRIPEKV